MRSKFLSKPYNTEILDKIDEHVGERIYKRRTQLKLTQMELARGIGVTYQQLQKYESGKNRVSASRLYALSVVLCVKPSYFFKGLE